jgi:tetratricopeptide (TPR) repeat protein
MTRFRGHALAMVLAALLIPASLLAQQKPKDSKYTKDAQKFLGLAMMRTEGADRTKFYQDALNALQEGFEKDAANPKFWFTAGQAYAGVGEIEKAKEAFEKAVELYPEYSEEITGEREAAWMEGFSRGVDLMDAQKLDEALAMFEAANAIYPDRPEGYLNVGSIYANRQEIDKAIAAFEQAIAAAQGPLLEQLEEEGKTQWKGYQELAAVNIAQMRGAQGVDAFQAGNYKESEELFRKAAETNPHSRDFLFNIVQASYAQSTKLEEELEATPSSAAEVDPQLKQIYEGLKVDIKKVQEYDPNNESLYQILARAEKRLGELSGDIEAAQQGALAVLTELDKLPVDVDEISIVPGPDGSSAEITGTLKNRKLEAGAPVTIKLTLLDRNGAPIAEEQVTVTAPEKDATTTFNAKAETAGQIAGWKYVVS